MGVHGWRVIDPANMVRTLTGTVDHLSYNGGHTDLIDNDGDWSVFIKPDKNSSNLLYDIKGFPNKSGLVECEVKPSTDETEGGDDHSGLYDRETKNLIVGVSVEVTGPWVIDRSHSWDDTDCVTSACDDDGKTEIHPIHAIFAKLYSLGKPSNLVELFVFSDNNDGHPPTWRENIIHDFLIVFPGKISLLAHRKFKILYETDFSKKTVYNQTVNGPSATLSVHVESGTYSDISSNGGRGGFYHSVVRVGWNSESLREAIDGLGDPSKGLRSIHPWFDGTEVSLRKVMWTATGDSF